MTYGAARKWAEMGHEPPASIYVGHRWGKPRAEPDAATGSPIEAGLGLAHLRRCGGEGAPPPRSRAPQRVVGHRQDRSRCGLTADITNRSGGVEPAKRRQERIPMWPRALGELVDQGHPDPHDRHLPR
jgi:hypothetical protein